MSSPMKLKQATHSKIVKLLIRRIHQKHGMIVYRIVLTKTPYMQGCSLGAVV
jgi:hypothetical protein